MEHIPNSACRFPLDSLSSMNQEKFVVLKKARVVLADYHEILNSFPNLRERFGKSPDCRGVCELLDDWVIQNAGVMSSAQCSENHLNTPVPRVASTVIGYRSSRMGRSCILPVEEDELKNDGMVYAVDVKGCGIREGATDFTCEHRNGLLDLDKALEDYLKERLVARVLRHASTNFGVVKTLAIIDCGFLIVDGLGERGPAALCVRQAALRPLRSDLPSYGSVEQSFSIEVELVLRSYGITTCDSKIRIEKDNDSSKILVDGQEIYSHYPKQLIDTFVQSQGVQIPFTADRINVQATALECPTREYFRLIDFGHYAFRKEFVDPIISLVNDRPFAWGGMLGTDSPQFCQPNGLVSSDWIDIGVMGESSQPRGIVYDGFVNPMGRRFARIASRKQHSASQLQLEAERLIDESTNVR